MKKILTGATVITLTRMALALPIFWCIASGWTNKALILFMVAAASDALDGYIARRYNQVSHLGAFLDPVADKLLVLTLIVACWWYGYGVPAWLVVLMLVKESLLGIGAIVMRIYGYCQLPINARRSGKVAMIVSVLYGCMVLRAAAISSFMPEAILHVMPVLLVLMHLYAFYDYARMKHNNVRNR